MCTPQQAASKEPSQCADPKPGAREYGLHSGHIPPTGGFDHEET